MFLQFAYNLWKFLLRGLLLLFFLAAVSVGALFVIIQTDPAKLFITDYLEKNFNSKYEGKIKIGKLDGVLPFQFTVTDFYLAIDHDNGEKDTLLTVDAFTITPVLWDLLFNQLSIRELMIENPTVYLKNGDDSFHFIRRALSLKEAGEDSHFIEHINVYAPAVRILSGSIYADRLPGLPDFVHLPEPFHAYGLDLTLFLEIDGDNRLIDIDNFEVQIPAIAAGSINLTGQIFNEAGYLEMNMIHLSAGNSNLTLNSQIDGVDLLKSSLFRQFSEAVYNIQLLPSTIFASEMSDIIYGMPETEHPLSISGMAKGQIKDFILSDMSVSHSDSRLEFSSRVSGLTDRHSLHYHADIDHLTIADEDIRSLVIGMPTVRFTDWQLIGFSGEVSGNAGSLDINLNMDFPEGDARFTGVMDFHYPRNFSGNFRTANLDLARFESLGLAKSGINLKGSIEGRMPDMEAMEWNADLGFVDSFYDNVPVPYLKIDARYANKLLEPEFEYEKGVTFVNGAGSVDFSRTEPVYRFNGEASLLNLSDIIRMNDMPGTSLNFSYDVSFQGSDIDRVHGRANLDVHQSEVNGEIVAAHQFYVDLDRPENPKRTLRFTSSIMDIFLEGDIRPSRLLQTGRHWEEYFRARYYEELLFAGQEELPEKPEIPVIIPDTLKSLPSEMQPLSLTWREGESAEAAWSETETKTQAPVRQIEAEESALRSETDVITEAEEQVIRHEILSAGEHPVEVVLQDGRSAEKSAYRVLLPEDETEMQTDEPLELNLEIELKDTDLIRHYFPMLPVISSSALVQFDIKAGKQSLLLTGGGKDQLAHWNGYRLENPQLMLTAHFRHGEKLSDFSSIDLEALTDRLEYGQIPIQGIKTGFSMRKGAFDLAHHIERLGKNTGLTTRAYGQLNSSTISATVDKLELGRPGYYWTNQGSPSITYHSDKRIKLDNFIFENADQMIDIKGVFSDAEDDSISYHLRNIDLGRISDMLGSRVNFQGMLNGEFNTRSLTRHPAFQGDLEVDRFAVDNRVVGDVGLTSTYNQELRRFDTRLGILTDSLKYASYLEDNDGRGQDIVLDGYFTPNSNAPDETLFHFDAEFREIDLWVLPHIVTNIFEKVEGRGTGSGYLTGNRDDYYFYADLQAHDAYVKPVFFNTEYRISGPVRLDRHEGVFLDTLVVRDNRSGEGLLYGHVALNNFEPEKDMNVTLEMNRLAFLNNTFEPESYFYGSVAGTGVVNVSGSNLSPFVRTLQPIRTTPRSRLSIPLLDETRVDAQGRSIQFVSDFAEAHRQNGADRNAMEMNRQERQFNEVFQLDLHFIASDNSTVQLVFDPVTGDILNAEGSGRIRITLEDEELQMFGNFDITDGDYQFVGGDIFARKFNLRQGGNIRWDGDPVNARLNITAVYRSRPNINALLSRGVTSEQPQRVPVDLLLDITGTIDNIENDFYFEFPNAVDATQNAAILALLNSEEQKLLQATSLLFTGGFIPAGAVGSAQTQEFGSTMQSRTAQVGLSQLLSSQINTMLNNNLANLANLDIDLNLSGFDQADLGIALRLFDDRLVLRRDGQVAGAYVDIGDVGAKYRINNALSVEIFHRKDPALMSIIGNQGRIESVNGVGLEAQMQFNSWKQLRQRVWSSFTALFGIDNSGSTEN